MTFRELTCIRTIRVFVLPLVMAALAASALAAPRKPLDDGELLERLPLRAGDGSARELAALRAAMLAAPGVAGPAALLAQAYFDLAMARGDPRYVGYAEAVIARFGEPRTASLRVVRGLLRQYRHDFGGALDDFAAALALDPDFAAAHA